MKTLINSTKLSNRIGIDKSHLANQNVDDEVEIIDYFENPNNGQLIISLHSKLFVENQQKIYIRDDKLIIIVSEIIHSFKSNGTYISDWQSFGQQSYVRMRNISLFLPGDNFYLLRHYIIAEKMLLNVVLAKQIDN